MSREEIERDLVNQVLEEIKSFVEASRLRLNHRLTRHSKSLLRARRSRSEGFEVRLKQRWREPLDLYEVALYLTQNLGSAFTHSFAQFATRPKFRALIRLHGNAALIAGEVLQLLKSGFPSGAHARWRSLHETGIISAFLTQASEDTAERFIAHDAVKSLEDANAYQKHCSKLGEEPFSLEEILVLERRRDVAVQKYGEQFAGSYGWAHQALLLQNPERKGRIQFSDIEAATTLDFWNPYYRMASHSVHPTAKTIVFNVGSLFPIEELNLAGPSNYGLADPGYHSLIATNVVNKALVAYAHDLARKPDEDLDISARMGSYEPALQATITMSVLEDIAIAQGKPSLEFSERSRTRRGKYIQIERESHSSGSLQFRPRSPDALLRPKPVSFGSGLSFKNVFHPQIASASDCNAG